MAAVGDGKVGQTHQDSLQKLPVTGLHVGVQKQRLHTQPSDKQLQRHRTCLKVVGIAAQLQWPVRQARRIQPPRQDWSWHGSR